MRVHAHRVEPGAARLRETPRPTASGSGQFPSPRLVAGGDRCSSKTSRHGRRAQSTRHRGPFQWHSNSNSFGVAREVRYENSAPTISASCSRCCRSPGCLADGRGADLSNPAAPRSRSARRSRSATASGSRGGGPQCLLFLYCRPPSTVTRAGKHTVELATDHLFDELTRR
jgi:hypothetical protein